MRLPPEIGEFLRGLREERARTAATLLGLAWGTFSVVVLLAFGSSLERHLQVKAAGLGRNIAVVWPERTTKPFAGIGPGRPVLLESGRVLRLLEKIPELESLCPEFDTWERVEVGGKIYGIRVGGVYPSYAGLRSWKVERGGRFLDDLDIAGRRRSAVLGNRIARNLFGAAPAVGRNVILLGLPFTVVGVLAPKLQDSNYYGRDEDKICIPASTYGALFSRTYINNFVFRSRDPSVHARAVEEIYRTLGREIGFDPTDRAALRIWDTSVEERLRSYVFLGLELILGGSGALTLLVGGVGVGNLMFLRVRRRTREIGIAMALGATPRRVLRGVLAESLVLVAAGGLLGFLLSSLAIVAVAATPLTVYIGSPRLSPGLAAGTALLLGLTGLAAGYFPARRAARLDPVRALADRG